MFDKLATIHPFRRPRTAPSRASAFNKSHCNDNRPRFRRPADQRAHPKLPLVCHWIEVDGLIECRWAVAKAAPRDDAEPPPLGLFALARRPARQAV
jgi:hypothetical protein